MPNGLALYMVAQKEMKMDVHIKDAKGVEASLGNQKIGGSTWWRPLNHCCHQNKSDVLLIGHFLPPETLLHQHLPRACSSNRAQEGRIDRVL
jgi:hypothetical protein